MKTFLRRLLVVSVSAVLTVLALSAFSRADDDDWPLGTFRGHELTRLNEHVRYHFVATPLKNHGFFYVTCQYQPKISLKAEKNESDEPVVIEGSEGIVDARTASRVGCYNCFKEAVQAVRAERGLEGPALVDADVLEMEFFGEYCVAQGEQEL